MKTRNLISSAALAAFLFAGAPALRAQEPAAAHASPGDHGQDRTPEVSAPKGRVAHEAQAESKIDSKAEESGHESEVKLFGFALGSFTQWIIQLINLAIFGGVLWYLLKGPVKSAFASFKKDLEDRLAQAERDKAEGEAQIHELEAKMAGLQAELGEIMAKAATEAEAEKQRVIEAAKAEAANLLAAAESEIARQQHLASQELRALVAELAVEAAGKKLEAKVQGSAAQTVTDHAIAELGSVNGGPK